uniref:Argininosuccinate lyase n=1 Tax=Coccolithus braarudii TaxID=221442 RepID=A0A6T7IZX9_9EUKA|mmetsp:Transcript_44426/g.94506  ORF Transcript_44426/g.94506 Transcript_44426/m.94506 type:complete len:473 (+) Transcript_44426:57-1475(+)
MAKLWGGRFTGKTDPVMEAFNDSLGVDKVMWAADLDGSIAYSKALQAAKVITAEEGQAIRTGLEQVRGEWAAGTFEVKAGDEDIHTANERRLTELAGSVGGKVHTGRSRNDQVVTDLRLHLRGTCGALGELLVELVEVAAKRAAAEVDYLMPGYTHLQSAQPIRWGHWMLAHAWAWKRDGERLKQAVERMNECPLGSGALAGHPFGVDRAQIAADLGFDRPTPNSVDAVSDRDFVVELSAWAALLMVHLSRFAEDLIVYSTQEFGFVRCGDSYSTGSSLMPQKKNPDAAELLRGKSARVIGHHVTLLTMLKGLPTAYNKDLQEDKQALFDTLETVEAALKIASGVLATLEPQPQRMRAALNSFMLATDLSEYLVRKGVPFRETHHVSGRAVQLAEEKKCALTELSVAELKALHPLFEDDVLKVWDFEGSVERKDSIGGTSERRVLEQAVQLQAWADAYNGTGAREAKKARTS